MRSQDMPKFQSTMASLAEVFAKQLSPQLVDIYWDALKGLYIEQFVEAAKACVRYHKHFPKPADIYESAKQQEQAAPKSAPELPPPVPKWLGLVNGLFLRYVAKRRLDDEFKGDINVHGRRAQCLELADFFTSLEADGDPEATEDVLKVKFDRAMARVADLSAVDAAA